MSSSCMICMFCVLDGASGMCIISLITLQPMTSWECRVEAAPVERACPACPPLPPWLFRWSVDQSIHTAWCKKILHVWISRLPPTHQPRTADAQPISPDGTCVTELSKVFFARPCRPMRPELRRRMAPADLQGGLILVPNIIEEPWVGEIVPMHGHINCFCFQARERLRLRPNLWEMSPIKWWPHAMFVSAPFASKFTRNNIY